MNTTEVYSCEAFLLRPKHNTLFQHGVRRHNITYRTILGLDRAEIKRLHPSALLGLVVSAGLDFAVLAVPRDIQADDTLDGDYIKCCLVINLRKSYMLICARSGFHCMY